MVTVRFFFLLDVRYISTFFFFFGAAEYIIYAFIIAILLVLKILDGRLLCNVKDPSSE